MVSGKYSYIYFAKSNRTTYSTFSTPIKISEAGRPTPYDNAPVPAVAPNGDVYIVWMDSDVTNANSPPGKIRLKKSTDGGNTFVAPSPWAGSATVASFNSAIKKWPLAGSSFKQMSFPSIACDPTSNHNVYVVYAADPDGTGPDMGNVYFVRSNDGGSTWTTPMVINDDGGTTGQFQPWIKVKPNGYIDVVWVDGRNDTGGLNTEYDIYMATSTDGGVTFQTNQRVSDASFDVSGGTGWIGEYPGLDVDSTNAYVAWTDTNFGPTRLNPPNTPDRDIYFDIMPNPTNTPVGSSTRVNIRHNLAATFTSVASVGNTTVSFTAAALHPAPAGYSLIPSGSYYGYFDLSTTAGYTGDINIEFKYDQEIVGPEEAKLKLFHWTGSNWEDITTSVDTVNNVIFGQTSSLSTFTLALPSLGPKAYLPNITKNYLGWSTPFIVQNLGTKSASIQTRFYDKKGKMILKRNFLGVKPGKSISVNPIGISKLGSSWKGSVVVYADQPVASVVNEHSPTCSMAYEGFDPAVAKTKVSLPNITSKYYGWTTPFVVQNLGAGKTTVEIKFYKKGSTKPSYKKTITSINPGASVGINPAALSIGKFQGSVVVESKTGQKIGAIVNEHKGIKEAMSYDGFAQGNTKVFLPNITKKYFGWTTPFAIQNIGLSTTKVTVKFYKKGSATPTYKKTISSLPPGASVGINPSYLPVSSFQGSVVAESSVQPIVAVCNEHSKTDSMAYSGIGTGNNKSYLPNINRAYFGWNTPFVVQNLDTASAIITVDFFNQKGIKVKSIHGVTIPKGASKGFNPATYKKLGKFKGSVIVNCTNGKNITSIVNEQHISGQAMSYNGF